MKRQASKHPIDQVLDAAHGRNETLRSHTLEVAIDFERLVCLVLDTESIPDEWRPKLMAPAAAAAAAPPQPVMPQRAPPPQAPAFIDAAQPAEAIHIDAAQPAEAMPIEPAQPALRLPPPPPRLGQSPQVNADSPLRPLFLIRAMQPTSSM